MAELLRDGNRITVAGGQSSTDATSVLPFKIDPVTGRLLTDSASASSIAIGGTVTSGTTGSVLFVGAGPVLAQDNANFNYASATRLLTIDATGTTTSIHTGPAAGTSNLTLGAAGVEFIGTNNTAGGMNLTVGNKSNGTSAFVDLFMQNDLADASGTHYAVVNLNSSTYSSTAFGTALAVANQLGIYGTDGPTLIGSSSATGYLNIVLGGLASTNEIARFATTGMTIGLAGTLTGKISFAGATSGAIAVVGQAVGGANTLTLPAATDTLVGKATNDALTNKTYNGLTVTTTTGTLTMTNAKTLAVTNTLTLSGTDSTVMTFPTTSKTIAANDGSNWTIAGQAIGDIPFASSTTAYGKIAAVAVGNVLVSAGTGTQPVWSAGPQLTTIELGSATDTTIARVSAGVISVEGSTVGMLPITQTWTGQNKFNNFIDVNNAIAASGNAATVPVTFRLNTVTNNSAATLTITMTTASAVDGQMTIVRILDFSAVAQTITWVNTENSTITAPTTSNGSTTLFLTVGFIYNAGTSKWRCIASA